MSKLKLIVIVFALFMANQSGVLAKAHLPHLPRVKLPHGSGVSISVRARAIAWARSQEGCPYLYGGTGPCSAGFDCSGLIQVAYAHAGVSIPRTSEEQWASLHHVSVPVPGDLVFFTGSSIDPPPGHVGLVISSNKMIEAYGAGVPVRVSSFGIANSPPGDESPTGFASP